MSTDTLTHPPDTQNVPLEHWRIDPTRSSVEFHAQTLWGLATVEGRFERYEGTLDLQQNPVIELTIDAASLTTNLGLRDRHQRHAGRRAASCSRSASRGGTEHPARARRALA